MKPQARRGCTQATRQADSATRSGRRRRPHADTLAWWRRLAQSGVSAHEPQTPPVPPSPRPRKTKTLKRSTQGWQDSRTMHDSRGPCSEKGPSLARSARHAFPKGGLRGFSDAWRANIAKASSFWMHGGDMLPGRGAFPVRGPFGDAWSENIATDSRPGTHQGEILPSPSARERTVASRSWGTTCKRNICQFNTTR